MTDILKQFIKNTEKIGASVIICKSHESSFSKILQEIMEDEKEIHIDRYILSQFPELKNELSLKGKSVYEDNTNLEKSRIGLSYADYGIASTGSVCVNIAHSNYNKLSLLPLISVVLIKSENILDGINQIFPKIKNGNYVFITGPSATADMGSLVKGAHGPAQLYIIILND